MSFSFKTNTIFLYSFLLIQVSFSLESKTSFIEVDNLKQGDKIEGKMEINGDQYKAICDCNQVTPDTKPLQDANGPKCDPSLLKVHMDKKGDGASFDDIRNLIGNIEDLNYVNIPFTSFKCLDGRNLTPILGTPGGDAGEFILALSVYEDLIGGGKQLNQENVDNFLSSYLKNMPHNKFYMCTDDQAVAHLQKDLSVEGLNIKSPRAQLIPDLQKLILKPENIGDLHMKLMLKYPDQFAIRKEIPEMFLTSFFKILWNKEDDLSSKIDLEILTGDHNESAFVEACQTKQLSPLIPTKNKVISVFVNHLDAVSIRRAKIAQFFSEKVNHHMDPVDPVRMHNRLNHHGFIGLEITGAYIALKLPFYTINIA